MPAVLRTLVGWLGNGSPLAVLATALFFGQITDKLARDVVARILALVDESAKPIQIYVEFTRRSCRVG